ncbi:hypothetical protein [Streptomyces sp. NPDC054794]
MLSTLAVPACPTSESAEDTPVTLEVTGGGLDITVPQGPVGLGSVTVSSIPQSVTDQLGNVTVTDRRGGTAGWTTTAQAADFIDPSNTTISVSAPNSSTFATGVSGSNSATWNPTAAPCSPS